MGVRKTRRWRSKTRKGFDEFGRVGDDHQQQQEGEMVGLRS